MVVARRPMISVAAAIGLPQAIERAGRNADEVLRPLGLRRQDLSSPHGYIAAADFAQALEDAASLTGDDCFGLHFGAHYHPKNAGPLAYVVLNSPTMAVAFRNIARYLRVHNEAASVIFTRDGRWALLRHALDLPGQPSRQNSEFSMAAGLGLIRLMAGSEWCPVEVQFHHKAPADTGEHVRTFGAPVRFGCDTAAFVIDAELCDRQVPAADPRLYPIVLRYMDQIVDAIPHEEGLVAIVRRCVGEVLTRGEPTLMQVARQLALAPRTLQRRLKRYGVDFRDLLDDTRRRRSTGYLDDRRNSITDVAFLLGYSEVSAFNRAFKRWTGSAPSDYRRATRSGHR